MELGRKEGGEPACGTVTIATYNVRDGRGEGEGGEKFIGIVFTGQALDMVGVDMAVLQETKIMDLVFVSWSFEGYLILRTDAESNRRGEWHYWLGRTAFHDG